MARQGELRPHLVISESPESLLYGGRGVSQERWLPIRDRQAQAAKLVTQLQGIKASEQAVLDAQRRLGLVRGNGIQVQFVSEPNALLKLESLDLRSKGIELLSVVENDGRMLATVFVPEGKLDVFLTKVEEYAERNTRTNKPSHQALITPIDQIRLATLQAMWTDESLPFPSEGDRIWWELWFRNSTEIDYVEFLREQAPQLDLEVDSRALKFVERSVVLVRATPEGLYRSRALLAGLAEVKAAHDTASTYLELTELEQAEWAAEARGRLSGAPEGAAAVCVLDTGLNFAHALLQPIVAAGSVQSVDPAWGANDHDGHGTSMAGIAAFGDLTPILQSRDAFEARCIIESCKILPPVGSNDPKLYGAITRSAVGITEIAAPNRPRTFQSAITAEGLTTGKPSSWSAAIDSLASGAEDDVRRLFVLSVGNVNWVNHCDYPAECYTSACEDPSQSWNSLSVGGFTEKTTIDASNWPNDEPQAETGGLSPESRTSLTWSHRWPIRPDIVMEAGNLSFNPSTGYSSDLDDLALLSTGHEPIRRAFVATRGTSPASANAAGLAAEVMAKYPTFWPETVRALMVHSSAWTPAMLALANGLTGKNRFRHLLRTCGFGTPNRERLLSSASDDLTLVTQNEITPYRKVRGAGVKFRDMHLHRLPWPVETMKELHNDEVELRVTLSYFVEPSPGERGYSGPFTYASHGLRFALQQPTESEHEFKRRVNILARDEEDSGNYVGDAAGWMLGPTNRNKGSLHHDRWTGPAVELASRQHIAIFPIAGWWRNRPHLERVDRKARYALAVSLAVPTAETDIYAQVEQQMIPTEVAIEI